MPFEPAFPEYRQRVAESFARQAFMQHINAELVTVEPGFCEIHVSYDARLTQQHGYFHAGVVSTVADNAAGYAGYSLMEESASVLTVEFKLNLLSPGIGERLIGRATVLKPGKTLTICRSDVFVVRDGEEKLCAAAQCTLMQLRDRADEPDKKQ